MSTILFFSSVLSTVSTFSADKLVKRLEFYFYCSRECSSISLLTKLAGKVNTLTIKPDIISSCAGLPSPVVAHYINFMFIVFLIQYPSRKYMVIWVENKTPAHSKLYTDYTQKLSNFQKSSAKERVNATFK